MSIEQLISAYEEAQAYLDILKLDREKARKAVIPVEVRNELLAIDLEFDDAEEPVKEKIAALLDEIKGEITQSETTVNGDRHLFIFNGGRVSWDAKKLEELLFGCPDIAKARKRGAPYVTVRRK